MRHKTHVIFPVIIVLVKILLKRILSLKHCEPKFKINDFIVLFVQEIVQYLIRQTEDARDRLLSYSDR